MGLAIHESLDDFRYVVILISNLHEALGATIVVGSQPMVIAPMDLLSCSILVS